MNDKLAELLEDLQRMNKEIIEIRTMAEKAIVARRELQKEAIKQIAALIAQATYAAKARLVSPGYLLFILSIICELFERYDI